MVSRMYAVAICKLKLRVVVSILKYINFKFGNFIHSVILDSYSTQVHIMSHYDSASGKTNVYYVAKSMYGVNTQFYMTVYKKWQIRCILCGRPTKSTVSWYRRSQKNFESRRKFLGKKKIFFFFFSYCRSENFLAMPSIIIYNSANIDDINFQCPKIQTYIIYSVSLETQLFYL